MLKLSSTTSTNISKPQIKIPRAHTENKHKIKIYSQKNKDWIEGETKAPTEEGWLVMSIESEVQSGDSGSPVWNERLQAITGMLVARKRNGLSCYMISLWKIADAFKDKVSLLKKTIEPEYCTVPGHEYLEKIIRSIASDIKKSSIFKDNIISAMEVTEEDQIDLTKYLVDLCKEGEVLTVIQGLQSALLESIDFMDGSAMSVATIEKELKIACSLLSKLVLFSIREEWMQQHLEKIAIQGHSECLLPEMDLRHIGIITDRQFQLFPELNSEIKKKPFISGVLLESGIDDDQRNRAVRDALKQLYCIVLKGINTSDLKDDDFRTGDCEKIKELRETIIQRQIHPNWRIRKIFFMAVTTANGAEGLDNETQKTVAKMLPELQWIVLKSQDDEQAFVVSDRRLKTLIDEFYRILGE